MFKKKRKRNTNTVDGLINGGLISGWAYIRNNIFVGKWMGLYPGELKSGILRYMSTNVKIIKFNLSVCFETG